MCAGAVDVGACDLWDDFCISSLWLGWRYDYTSWMKHLGCSGVARRHERCGLMLCAGAARGLLPLLVIYIPPDKADKADKALMEILPVSHNRVGI